MGQNVFVSDPCLLGRTRESKAPYIQNSASRDREAPEAGPGCRSPGGPAPPGECKDYVSSPDEDTVQWKAPRKPRIPWPE
jgi:hypothetical protein